MNPTYPEPMGAAQYQKSKILNIEGPLAATMLIENLRRENEILRQSRMPYMFAVGQTLVTNGKEAQALLQEAINARKAAERRVAWMEMERRELASARKYIVMYPDGSSHVYADDEIADAMKEEVKARYRAENKWKRAEKYIRESRKRWQQDHIEALTCRDAEIARLREQNEGLQRALTMQESLTASAQGSRQAAAETSVRLIGEMSKRYSEKVLKLREENAALGEENAALNAALKAQNEAEEKQAEVTQHYEGITIGPKAEITAEEANFHNRQRLAMVSLQNAALTRERDELRKSMESWKRDCLALQGEMEEVKSQWQWNVNERNMLRNQRDELAAALRSPRPVDLESSLDRRWLQVVVEKRKDGSIVVHNTPFAEPSDDTVAMRALGPGDTYTWKPTATADLTLKWYGAVLSVGYEHDDSDEPFARAGASVNKYLDYTILLAGMRKQGVDVRKLMDQVEGREPVLPRILTGLALFLVIAIPFAVYFMDRAG